MLVAQKKVANLSPSCAEAIKGKEIPKELICPLSGKVFVDPVTSSRSSSKTYERKALLSKLGEMEQAGQPAMFDGIAAADIISNVSVRNLICSLISNSGSIG